MVKRTVSELAFEEYLSKQGIVYRYEELPNGITQPTDYSFEIEGKTLRVDVKEWEQKEQLTGLGAPFDPYKPVRNKIEEGLKKFKQYKGRNEPCALVLYHYGSQFIELDNISVLGAVFGDFGWVFPINPDTGVEDVSETKIRFTAGGKMIHQTPKASMRVQNTTISAIVVLKSIQVKDRRVYIALKRREATAERKFTIEETVFLLPELYNADESIKVEPCVTVYDNLDAAVSLPYQFPSGPYDERFGKCGDRLCRTYVGTELAAIESEEEEVGIRLQDPLGFRK